MMESKPVLILLHGALGSSAQFSGLNKLLDNNFEVHTLNFSGHGGKNMPDSPFTIELFTGDVLSYMDATGITQANIFGYSMGGYVAVTLALNNPSRVISVMTLATKFDWSTESALKEISMIDPLIMISKVPDFVSTLKIRHSPVDWGLVVNKTREMMLHLGEHHLENDDIKRIAVKLRLVVGDKDKMVSVDSTYKIFKLLLNGSMLVLPDTRHPFEMADESRLEYEIKNYFCGS